MCQLKGYSASDALEWMKDQSRGDGQVLFRGQTRYWPTIKPSITRDDEDTRRAMWDICRVFHSRANAISGYRTKPGHHRLGILQHYILRSPVIDLTGTPEIALYFAISGAIPGQECVVFSVDQRAAESDAVVFSDHDFLMLPREEGGLTHRWLRQNGYSVGPERWRNRDLVQNFDMLRLDGVSCMRFTRHRDDDRLVEKLGDLESTAGDPLVRKVRWIVQDIAKDLKLLTPSVRRVLESSKTIDPDVELAIEIKELITVARATHDAEALATLQELKASHEDGVWDTGFTASLLWVRDRLQSHRSQRSPGSEGTDGA